MPFLIFNTTMNVSYKSLASAETEHNRSAFLKSIISSRYLKVKIKRKKHIQWLQQLLMTKKVSRFLEQSILDNDSILHIHVLTYAVSTETYLEVSQAVCNESPPPGSD